MKIKKRKNNLSIIIFFAFFFIYSFFIPGFLDGDSSWSFYTARQIFFNHTLALEERDLLNRVQVGLDGKYYCCYPTGRYAIYIPAIIIASIVLIIYPFSVLPTLYLFASFTMPFFMALCIVILYKIISNISSKKNVFNTIILAGFGSLFFLYAHSSSIENIQTFFLLLSFYLLFKFKTNSYRSESYFLLSGICFATACSLKIYSVVLLPAYIYYVYKISHNKLRNIIYFCLPVMVYYFFQILLFYKLFGIEKIIGRETKEIFAYPFNLSLINSILVLLISPERGIVFFMFPIIIAFILSFKKFFKEFKYESHFLLIFSFVLFLFISYKNPLMTMSYGPRYLIPLMFFLAIPSIMLSYRWNKVINILILIFVILHIPFMILREFSYPVTLVLNGGYISNEDYLSIHKSFYRSDIIGNWRLLLSNGSMIIKDRNMNEKLISNVKPQKCVWFNIFSIKWRVPILIIWVLGIFLFCYKLIKYFSSHGFT